MWKISVLGCFLLIATVVEDTCGKELPADIEKCNYGDAQCLMERLNYVFQKYPHGNPELLVPDLNPLRIDSLEVNQDSSKSVSLNIKMSDINLEDFHTVRFHNTTGAEGGEFNNTVLTYYASCPIMNINSKYAINGKMLVFPIKGSGDMHMVMSNTTIAVKLKISIQKKDDGKAYIYITKLKIKTLTEKINIHMDNLFNGDKTLGDNMNKVMNENWRVIWEDVEPEVDRSVAQKMLDTMRAFYDTYAVEDIFLFPK